MNLYSLAQHSEIICLFSLLCKLLGCVALRGQKSKKTVTCESKVACKFSKKMSQNALNHVLIVQNDRSRRELSESSGIIEKGAFCVELRPFYCSKRISVPMSYIISFCHGWFGTSFRWRYTVAPQNAPRYSSAPGNILVVVVCKRQKARRQIACVPVCESQECQTASKT